MSHGCVFCVWLCVAVSSVCGCVWLCVALCCCVWLCRVAVLCGCVWLCRVAVCWCVVRVGEGRACWSLGNAYVSLANHRQALHYARRHLDISKEVREGSRNTRPSDGTVTCVLCSVLLSAVISPTCTVDCMDLKRIYNLVSFSQ